MNIYIYVRVLFLFLLFLVGVRVFDEMGSCYSIGSPV